MQARDYTEETAEENKKRMNFDIRHNSRVEFARDTYVIKFHPQTLLYSFTFSFSFLCSIGVFRLSNRDQPSNVENGEHTAVSGRALQIPLILLPL